MADKLKAIFAQESREAAMEKAMRVIEDLKELRLSAVARTLERGIDQTLSIYKYPPEHQRCLRTNNHLERVNREVRR